MKNLKTTLVFLGRFSPIHKGHQMVIDKMISKFGIKNCLIIIGSTNSLNKRTPYTYVERRKMIKMLYPGLKILPIPDSSPNIEKFDAKGDAIWLKSIKKLESKLDSKFVFLGGSRKDLKILAQEFATKLFVARHKEGMKLSATLIREKLQKKDISAVSKLVDPRILKLASRVRPLRSKKRQNSRSRVGP